MNNKYILLRHGETIYQAKELDAIYPADNKLNLSMTEKGEEMIEKASDEIKGIDLIYSSDFSRTKKSAEIIAKKNGLTVIFDERLGDTNFGVFSGKTGDEYRKYFVDRKERFIKPTPDGESWNDVRTRVVAVIKEIEEKYKDKTILIVSHADPIWLMMGYLKGLSDEDLLEQRNPKGVWPDVGQYFIIK